MQRTKYLIISALLGLASITGVHAGAVDNASGVQAVAEQGDSWSRPESVNLSTGGQQRLRLAAQSGQPNAQYAIGMSHHARRDNAAALYWLHKAALQGHVPAQYTYQLVMTADNHTEIGW